MEACHKRCVCSLFLLQLLLLQGSDSHPSGSQILAATTDNDAFSGKEGDATTIGSYYNVGGRKMRGVKTLNDMGATDNEGMKKKKICKEGAVKVGLRNGVEFCSKKKQYRGGFGGGGEGSKVVEESGFVALNADYHTPRHHPPKNN